jgi:NAD(P)-dependent dehydrogenase (short-subunit alcohol dehydrogenase family)
MRLEGKSAIVTGSARGIGQAIAMSFAAEGARVLVADILDGTETVSRIGPMAVYQETDLEQEPQIESMVARAQREFGGVDILVNNAVVQYEQDLEVLTVDTLDHMYRVNLRGVILCCKHAVPRMLQRGGGNIVNIASVMGVVGDPPLIGYSAMKGGVLAATVAVAVSYAGRGIRCNAILPGDVNTRLSDAYWQQFTDPNAAKAEIEALYPLKRFAEPSEIASIALFLASSDSAFMTGSYLRADGGLLAAVYQGKSMA